MEDASRQGMGAAPPSSPESSVSALGRIPGVFFSPVQTFESIARRPTWLPPLILWTAVSLLFTAFLISRIDFDRMIRTQMERRGQTVPEERIQAAVAMQKKIAPVAYNGIAAVTPAALSLLVAVVLWGAFKAFGWDLSYRQAFGATAHAFLPGVLGSLILFPVVLRQEAIDPTGLQDMLRSNLGFLVERKASPVVHSLLQSLDVFSLWSLVLLIIGFAAAARVSRKSAAGVIVALWALFVLGKAGFAAIFS